MRKFPFYTAAILFILTDSVIAKFLQGPCQSFSCLNGGSCYAGVNSTHWCRCISSFKGDRCEKPSCEKECLNGGICARHDNGTYSCHCHLAGFKYGLWSSMRAGPNRTVVIYRKSSTCHANVTIKIVGTTGDNCEHILRNVCESDSACNNHGKCVLTRNLNEFECHCDEGWIGDTCSEPDPCPLAYCNNGGKCIKNGTEFTCSCSSGFYGKHCELDIDECEMSPCAFGKCFNLVGSYRCECDAGFIGKDCQVYRSGFECTTSGPNACRNGGVCISDANNNTCVCPPMYQGLYCEKDVDECSFSNPCENAGTCVNIDGGFQCLCTAAFEGELCSVNKDDCKYHKCEAGATCVDLNGSYRCECPRGKIGSFCQFNDPCLSMPCLNGRCIVDLVTGNFTCACDRGYTVKGTLCDKDIDECAEWGKALCYNGATCVNVAGTYTCECPPGVTGASCDTLMELCDPNPCENGGICIDRLNHFECSCLEGFSGPTCAEKCRENEWCSCSMNSCMNGGYCKENKCKCLTGFTGRYCEKKLDPCIITKCPFGHICIENNKTNSISCECPVGFTGFDCQSEIDECSMNPCQHGGTCSDRFNDYHCTCLSGYSGKNCEQIVDHCLNNPCMNNGVCINAARGSICHCTAAFFGEKCQFKRKPCTRSRCDNGGICHPTANYRSYTCECKPGFEGTLCLNGARCIDLVDDYKCECLRGYTGQNCQIFVNIDKYNDTDRMERNLCDLSGCHSKAGDGKCDVECNFYACGFDDGDCSARGQPFSRCDSPSYCAHVFKDGNCDTICNNESCLFDGFDCVPSSTRCPPQIVDYCGSHYGDGICDHQCNLQGCAFDGGDCSTEKSLTLSGDISIVILTSPKQFVKHVDVFLMTLSQKLRASVRIKSDEEGPLVFLWSGRPSSKRVTLPHDQHLSARFAGEFRSKRSTLNTGVLVWIEVDVSGCHGDCFSDDLSEMGMPIYEAVARHRDTTAVVPSSDGYWAFIIGCFAILIIIATVFVLQQRTRKRRMIKAPCWIPPTEAQNKLASLSQSEQMLRAGFYSDHLFGTKKPRLENLNFYDSNPFNSSFHSRKVEVMKAAKTIHPPPTILHEQASSTQSIEVDSAIVNERGPFGRTALMMLCDNMEKSENQVIEEVAKIWAAGGDLNMQDEDEETAIFIAVRRGRLNLTKKLLDMGADPTIMNRNDSTCLHEAAANCNLHMVEELLKHNSVVKEIDVCDNNDRTPLMRCAANDTVDHRVAAHLIRLGADPSYPGDKSALSYNGRTALHYAAQVNNVQMIEFLISKDANKDAQDLEDRTPLFLAASHGHVEAVQALVKAGASLEITDQKDRTPYKVAEENEFRNVLEVLDSDSHRTSVPLHMALGKNSVKSNTRQVKRIPVKRKPQPLTPPHSDGCGSTPSPHATFGAISRPNASVLDSPSSDRTSNGTDGLSPTSLPMTHPPCWPTDVSQQSPPYENNETNNPTYTSQAFSVPYPSCQYSERSVANAYYSNQ
ncbi:EGF-like domain protein [Dictyocaulus viviparus]|uniref:EGF-like domain protein n=1 Tax=Dictyocaulus viviparus TaxID=29172 RepID=A0A0D8XF69_DICVI|nr:EGF-like domain protein [Dictyocaulus viviparus]